jgi:hypothetical protein
LKAWFEELGLVAAAGLLCFLAGSAIGGEQLGVLGGSIGLTIATLEWWKRLSKRIR